MLLQSASSYLQNYSAAYPNPQIFNSLHQAAIGTCGCRSTSVLDSTTSISQESFASPSHYTLPLCVDRQHSALTLASLHRHTPQTTSTTVSSDHSLTPLLTFKPASEVTSSITLVWLFATSR